MTSELSNPITYHLLGMVIAWKCERDFKIAACRTYDNFSSDGIDAQDFDFYAVEAFQTGIDLG